MLNEKRAGQAPTPKLLATLLSSRPSNCGAAQADTSEYHQGINFTTFLTMMSEKLLELDPEDVLLEAFECFDDHDKGANDARELREWLATVGDKMSKEEVRFSLPFLSSLQYSLPLNQPDR